ncbi:MAG: DUF2730 family protein, partial [Pseudomonadota bacterium]
MLSAAQIDLLLKVMNIGGVFAVAIYTFFATRQKKVELKFDAQSLEIDDIKSRLREVERKTEDAPTHADIHQLGMKITELRGDIKAVIHGQDAQQDLMERQQT